MTQRTAGRRGDPIDELAELFAGEGARDYLGEAVSQASHMLQAAHLAAEAGSTDHLVAAALLHDVGHFRGTRTGADLMRGDDNRHQETGAAWLARAFPRAVTEPVRLHVDAKRYLCAVEPGYLARLSDASRFTLSVQGGPMDAEERRSFEAAPFHPEALVLRHFDERAKDPDAPTPGFEHFRALLERLVGREQPRSPRPGRRLPGVQNA